MTVFPSFHTFKGASLSHKLLGNFCYLKQLLIFGANLLNFKQLMAIKKPYNTIKSCYAIYARKLNFSSLNLVPPGPSAGVPTL